MSTTAVPHTHTHTHAGVHTLARIPSSSPHCPQQVQAHALPLVEVPLACPEDLPHAVLVLRHMYTGSLPHAGTRDPATLLRVRRQAAALGVAACVAECDATLLAWLQNKPQPDSTNSNTTNSSNGISGASHYGRSQVLGGGAAGQQLGQQGHGQGQEAWTRVLQLYRCHEVFPDVGNPEGQGVEGWYNGAFEVVRRELEGQLLGHFGDAVCVLTSPLLMQNLQQLPACALEVLLKSDAFGTDSESSVLLLLLSWLHANGGGGGAGAGTGVGDEQRRRLWGCVRLSQLTRSYVAFVLPGCREVARSDLGVLSYMMSVVDEQERASLPLAQLLQQQQQQELPQEGTSGGAPAGGVGAGGDGGEEAAWRQGARGVWFGGRPRRQVVPEGGRVVEWSVTGEQLLEASHRAMSTGQPCLVAAAFACTASTTSAANGGAGVAVASVSSPGGGGGGGGRDGGLGSSSNGGGRGDGVGGSAVAPAAGGAPDSNDRVMSCGLLWGLSIEISPPPGAAAAAAVAGAGARAGTLAAGAQPSTPLPQSPSSPLPAAAGSATLPARASHTAVSPTSAPQLRPNSPINGAAATAANPAPFTASLHLSCHVPQPLYGEQQQNQQQQGSGMAGWAWSNARLAVHGWDERGRRTDALVWECDRAGRRPVSFGGAVRFAAPLGGGGGGGQVPRAGGGGSVEAGGDAVGALAGWLKHMRGGRVTGTITFHR